jgi:hypothetical protein
VATALKPELRPGDKMPDSTIYAGSTTFVGVVDQDGIGKVLIVSVRYVRSAT